MTEPTFALGTFARQGAAFPGLVVDGTVHDTRTTLPGHAGTGALLAEWDETLPRLAALAAEPGGPGVPVHELRVLPPVSPPGQIFGAGANYREHVVQMSVAHRLGRADATAEELADEAGREIDERQANGTPYVWTGVPSALSGAYDDVVLPTLGSDHDWELELGVVIGRTARQVSVTDALDHVAGFTICNDLTTRSLVARSDIPMMGTDWLRAKNFPTFYPTGPWLVPTRFVPDPLDLKLQLRLNGAVMQSGSTGDMIFGPAQLIAYLSTITTLLPGDLVITGSPAGNGSHHGRFLRAGDVLECEIEGLGTQRNLCVNETAPPVAEAAVVRQSVFVVSGLLAVAERGGHFAAAGIEVRTRQVASSAEQWADLREGRCDVALTAIDNLFVWNAAGPRIALVGQIEATTLISLVTRPGLPTLADVPVARLAVDAPNNGFAVLLRLMASHLQLGPQRYELVEAGGVRQRLDALLRGEVDATLLSPPLDTVAINAGGTPALGVSDVAPGYPGLGLVAPAAAGRTRVEPYLAALKSALCWVRTAELGEVAELLAEDGQGSAEVAALLSTLPASLVPDERGLHLLAAIRAELGMTVPGAPRPDQLA